MGNWSVTIQGVGQHHNNSPKDIEALTAGFICDLHEAGHTVDNAVVTTGSKIVLSVTQFAAEAEAEKKD